MSDTATLTAPSESSVEIPSEGNVRSPLGLNLYLVQVNVSAPSGESKIKNAKVTKTVAGGEEHEVLEEKRTTPRNKYRNHPIWKKFVINKGLFYSNLDLYSCVSPAKGMRQVPGTKVPELILKFVDLREQRRAIVAEYVEAYPIIVDQIKVEFPDQDDQDTILRLLPKPTEAEERFGVEWNVWPLTPLSADSIDVSDLNDTDKVRFVREQNDQVRQMMTRQAKAVVDDLIVGLLDEIRDFDHEKLSSGKLREGSLTPILNAVQKLSNFEGILDPVARRRLLSLKETLKAQDPKALNDRPILQKAIRDLIGPVVESVTTIKLQAEEVIGRRERSVDI